MFADSVNIWYIFLMERLDWSSCCGISIFPCHSFVVHAVIFTVSSVTDRKSVV